MASLPKYAPGCIDIIIITVYFRLEVRTKIREKRTTSHWQKSQKCNSEYFNVN